MSFKAKRPFDVVGRIVSLLVFAFGLVFLHWSAAIALAGFWLEEVLTLVFLLIRLGVATGKKRISEEESRSRRAGIAVLLFFPFVHFIFIAVFMFFLENNDPAAEGLAHLLLAVLRGRVDGYQLRALLPLMEVGAALLLWGIVDLVRDSRAGAASMTPSSFDFKAKACLVLPHITIIIGGFLFTAFKAANWLAWALILGKCLFEIFLLPGMESEAAKSEIAAAAEVTAAAVEAAAATDIPAAPDPEFRKEGP
jgi:hypothetical protein